MYVVGIGPNVFRSQFVGVGPRTWIVTEEIMEKKRPILNSKFNSLCISVTDSRGMTGKVSFC